MGRSLSVPAPSRADQKERAGRLADPPSKLLEDVVTEISAVAEACLAEFHGRVGGSLARANAGIVEPT